MKKYVVIFLVCCLLMFTGCSSDSTSTTANEAENTNDVVEVENSNEVSNQNTANESEETDEELVEVSEPVKTEFYLNELVEIGDLIISLNSVEKSMGVEYFEPEEGNKYVILDLTFHNVGEETYTLSSMLGFELVDNDQYTYDTSWSAPTKGSLDGTILPGQKLRGQVGFEIPENSIATELLFDYDFFTSGQVVFLLDPEMSVEPVNFENPVAFDGTKAIEEIIETDDFTFVANSFKLSEGSQYFGPDEGNVYYVVDVSMTNNSSEAQSISTMLMFEMQDELGYRYDVAIYTEAKGSIDGDIAAGKTSRGEIAFEVPADLANYTLLYSPGVFEDEMYVIDLNQ